MASSQALSTDVLIVGGGPVGLALANELGMRGISALLIEQQDRVGSQPRAKTTNVRSMEHMRRWGIADRIRESSPLPRGYPTDIYFLTRLFGHQLAHIENAFNGAPARDDRYSEQAQWIPQYVVEAVLKERLAAWPSVRTLFATRLDGFAQSARGVEARAVRLGDNAVITIRAQFLVGADGARSMVRELIGARLEGRHKLANHYNMVIRIPEFAASPPRQRGIMYWLVNPEAPAVLAPMDKGSTWTFGLTLKPGMTEMSDDEAGRRVWQAMGREISFEVVARDYWSAHRLIANRYRDARVFLAGDACHLHPPFGGYGMNMGIGDAVDLGWKLAATLQGWGGPELLDSYERERRPVHVRVLDESVQNYSVLSQHLVRDDLEHDGEAGAAARRIVGEAIIDSKTREFKSLGVVLGSHYSGSPIIVSDGTEPPGDAVTTYVPSAHPGCLAPHAWIDDRTSLYDRFGQDFTLLKTGMAEETDVERLAAAAADAGVPLRILDLHRADLRDLYQAKLTLIRPDQHIAWRSDDVNFEPAALIDRVRGVADAQSDAGLIRRMM
jgi:2-polyprenyl-6-methoxyphenol hydroxylase-like FAD-dependent oxidoreductase